MTTVVIADDQDLVRTGFRLILSAAHPQITVMGEAGTGRAAIALIGKLQPDVVLMDVRMPDMDGIEATRHLIRTGSPTRVLMLTTFDVDQYVYDAFRAGASGFLLKNAPAERLIEAVHAVAAGDALLAPELTRRLIERYLERPVPNNDHQLRTLSGRERQVLILIARGLANQEIADSLFLSPGTVKTHVTRILHKLNLRDRVQAVVLAYETGLISPGDPKPSNPSTNH